MLQLHPKLVEVERADQRLAGELRSASAQRGRDYLERFVASVVRDLASPVAR
jgi:hypothetical protein